MEKEQIRALIAQMTLEEKAGLCSGADFWHTKAIERLGIPAVMVSDGPHGLRKQADDADHLGLNDSIKAVCFPAGCALAASFDKAIAEQLGETLGEECQAEHVSTILGPAMNIKRSPLCGRNFEYYSEDPYVSGEIAGALVKGIQSKHVGTSVKHFACNSQEFRRMTSNSVVDERTMREIYLTAFEKVVKEQKPWTLMHSYNKINGVYAGEHQELLTEILRKEWGFDGYVVSDWGGVNDHVEGVKAGCDLEMPGNNGVNDGLLVQAVQEGRLDETVLDEACERMLNIVFRYVENRDEQAVFDYEKDHETARKIAEECIVLLKNENEVLPLNKGQKVAFIGKYAKTPRYQGGGSSHINSFKTESAMDVVGEDANVVFAQGYEDARNAESNIALIEDAVQMAKASDVAVVFAGLPDHFESEGYDRKHMNLPENQNELIEAVAAAQPNTVVVLHNGSPVEMPWISRVKAVVEAHLGGQAVGGATARVLYGEVNPSGRLAETFPLRLEDTPCYLTYGGENDRSEYTEGVFVGYRYYTSRKMKVLFPFGHGLSYTTFSYGNLKVNKEKMKDSETVTVSVDVTNTGAREGKEVVQLYVAPLGGTIIRPVRELRGFAKINLKPGETKTVDFTLDKRAFAYWNTKIHDWVVETGSYEIQVGISAETIVLSQQIEVESTTILPKVYTLNSTMGEIMADPKGQMIMGQAMGNMNQETQAEELAEKSQSEAINDEMMEATMNNMPLRQLLSFVPGMKREMLEQLVAALNATE